MSVSGGGGSGGGGGGSGGSSGGSGSSSGGSSGGSGSSSGSSYGRSTGRGSSNSSTGRATPTNTGRKANRVKPNDKSRIKESEQNRMIERSQPMKRMREKIKNRKGSKNDLLIIEIMERPKKVTLRKPKSTLMVVSDKNLKVIQEKPNKTQRIKNRILNSREERKKEELLAKIHEIRSKHNIFKRNDRNNLISLRENQTAKRMRINEINRKKMLRIEKLEREIMERPQKVILIGSDGIKVGAISSENLRYLKGMPKRVNRNRGKNDTEREEGKKVRFTDKYDGIGWLEMEKAVNKEVDEKLKEKCKFAIKNEGE